MIIELLIVIIRIYIYIVIINALLSFVLPPYHAVRVTLDRLVNPLLNPIRRIMPQAQMIDFSPTVLIILLIILENILASI
jgi:YggT family protein